MKVTLEAYGGLAAVIDSRRRPNVLDTDTLPESAARELARLVAAAVSTPVEDDDGRARDAMSYTITMEESGRVTALEQSDGTMTPAFASLLTWLKKYFARQAQR
ncbi:protealysin inhibitor emfourin [Streptomyces sp. NK15101]|uniref:protealysin inhibitor emfourin n=1 Tax=Streptomyces sp. NK15101 TaxID=2873261 RepID=UPI001CEDE16D|nr:protealysin inhibitor emfourin [Streptomyces sp. NK15101]